MSSSIKSGRPFGAEGVKEEVVAAEPFCSSRLALATASARSSSTCSSSDFEGWGGYSHLDFLQTCKPLQCALLGTLRT